MFLRLAHVDTALKLFFARVGLVVARWPGTTVVTSLAVTALLALASVYFLESANGRDIWLPQNTQVVRNARYVERVYGHPFRVESAILSGKPNQDFATVAGLVTLIDFVEMVEGIRSPDGHTYDAICNMASSTEHSNVSYCSMASILDLFIANAHTAPVQGEKYSQAAHRALRGLHDSQIKRAISDADTFLSWSGLPLVRDQLVGGAAGVGVNFTASALQHTFLLSGSSDFEQNTPVHHWEIAFREALDLDKEQFQHFDVITHHEVATSFEQSMDGQILWIILGLVALPIYLVSTMGSSIRGSRIFIAVMTLTTVALALASTAGCLSLWLVPFTPAHNILPIILLGIGADDSFLIVKTFDALMREDKSFRQRPVNDRIALTMSSAGSSILVTSATNCAVFFLGAISPVPALRSFNIWAGVGVFFDFLFSVTFFVAVFKIDTVRFEAKRLDCLPCIKLPSRLDEAEGSNNYIPALHRVLSRSYADFLGWRPVQVCVITFFILLFGISTWGAATLQVVFSASTFNKVGSVQAQHDDSLSRYFEPSIRAGLFSKDVDFSDPETQQAYWATCNPASGAIIAESSTDLGSVDCWLEGLFPSGAKPQGELFFPAIQKALATGDGRRYRSDLVCASHSGAPRDCLDVNAIKLLSTRTTMAITSIGNTVDQVEALRSLERVARNSNVPNLFVSHPLFPFIELSGSVRRNSLFLLLGSFFVVSLVNVILIGHWFGALLVLVSVSGTSLLLVGMLQFWNVYLNPVSMIVLGMSIGLSVDGSTHIVRSYFEHDGCRAKRVRLALGDVGPAVLHGGVSTLAAISFLAFSDAFVMLVVFKSFFIILVGGLLHALVFLPVILNLIGPCNANGNGSGRRDAQNQILGDRLGLVKLEADQISSSSEDPEASEISDQVSSSSEGPEPSEISDQVSSSSEDPEASKSANHVSPSFEDPEATDCSS